MHFRGQEKRQKNPGALGDNPNEDGTDEYIVNLQQQIHFMELELKILREKVLEDEQKSGIGNLYDDDKTSHQHITLLKTKYAQMRRDFDRKIQDLSKQSLKIKGQEFVLDSQIEIIKDQTQFLKNQENEFNESYREESNVIDRTLKKEKAERKTIDDEIFKLTRDTDSSEITHKDNKLRQDLEVAFDEGAMARHNIEVSLATALKENKLKEKADLKAAL